MLKSRLTTAHEGATVESPNKPTVGTGPRPKPTRSNGEADTRRRPPTCFFLLNMLGVVWGSRTGQPWPTANGVQPLGIASAKWTGRER